MWQIYARFLKFEEILLGPLVTSKNVGDDYELYTSSENLKPTMEVIITVGKKYYFLEKFIWKIFDTCATGANLA